MKSVSVESYIESIVRIFAWIAKATSAMGADGSRNDSGLKPYFYSEITIARFEITLY